MWHSSPSPKIAHNRGFFSKEITIQLYTLWRQRSNYCKYLIALVWIEMVSYSYEMNITLWLSSRTEWFRRYRDINNSKIFSPSIRRFVILEKDTAQIISIQNQKRNHKEQYSKSVLTTKNDSKEYLILEQFHTSNQDITPPSYISTTVENFINPCLAF